MHNMKLDSEKDVKDSVDDYQEETIINQPEIQLPEEILSYIFQLIVNASGAVPSLCRLSQVNRLWRRIAMDRQYWRHVDLSSGWIKKDPKGLPELCKNQLGVYCESLSLEAWFSLKDDDLMVISTACKNLFSLDLSSCEKLSANALRIIADNFPELKSLKYSNMSPIATVEGPVSYFLRKRGPKLKHLDLSCNYIHSDLFCLVCKNCPQLETLVLNNIRQRSDELKFSITQLHHGCPKLQCLDLSGTTAPCPAPDRTVYLNLQTFKAPIASGRPEVNDATVFAAQCTPRLTHLELGRGHVECLSHVISPVLSHLQICFTHESQLLSLEKWKTSLTVLDISDSREIKREDLDKALGTLFKTTEFAKLHTLILCGTYISWNGLREVIMNCNTLQCINCVRCVNIPQCWKQEISGSLRDQLYQLYSTWTHPSEKRD